jgi:predicted glycosyltransferase
MKILIEAHHPAHIHFWKYPIRELQNRGHRVLLIGRKRDVMERLVSAYPWIEAETPLVGVQSNRFPLWGMLRRQWFVAGKIRSFSPDVVTSLMGSYTQSAKLLGVRNVIFTDSEFQHFNHRIAHPFADEIHTPECFYKELGAKQRRYAGIHELAFLDPKYAKFECDVSIKYPQLTRPYALIRVSAWNTFHDINHQGVGDALEGFVKYLSSHYQVVISAEESALTDSLKQYAATFAPEDFHAVLAGASFVLTEGASTASEAACLGVPTVYINSTEPRGYLQMLEARYGLLRGFCDASAGLLAAQEMVESLDDSMREVWKQKSQQHLNDSVDVVEYIVDTLLREG